MTLSAILASRKGMDERIEVVQRALGYPYASPPHSFVQLGGRTLSLDEVEIDLRERTAVVAYGSNAAPEALARKLAGDPDPLPLLRATLGGFDVAYSAHFAAYGAVPAALHPSAGTEVAVFAAFPTAAQLELISATEPNYELLPLEDARLRCEEAPALKRVLAFVTRHGCLRLDDTEVALAAVLARGRTLPAMSQRQLLERLRDALRPGLDLEPFVVECAAGKVDLTR
jgi:hypothetical protein